MRSHILIRLFPVHCSAFYECPVSSTTLSVRTLKAVQSMFGSMSWGYVSMSLQKSCDHSVKLNFYQKSFAGIDFVC